MTGILQRGGPEPQYEGVRPIPYSADRASPLDWARRRRRDTIHQQTTGLLKGTLEALAAAWRFVELDALTSNDEATPLLAIGPGGLFALTTRAHARHRVLIHGDILQINGTRPPYVVQARRTAKRASRALSASAGISIPVQAVLVLVGSGKVVFYGIPKECLVTEQRDLDWVLRGRADRLAATTVEKLHVLATHPATWAATQVSSYSYVSDKAAVSQ